MATPEEIAAKHTELQAAVAELSAANADHEAKSAPYLAAKQVLIDAIDKVGVIDDELERLVKDYEPQSKPLPL